MNKQVKNNGKKAFPDFLYARAYAPSERVSRFSAHSEIIRQSLPFLHTEERHKKCAEIAQGWGKILKSQFNDDLESAKGKTAPVVRKWQKNKLLQAFVFVQTMLTLRAKQPLIAAVTQATADGTEDHALFNELCDATQQNQTPLVRKMVKLLSARREATAAGRDTKASISPNP